MCSEDQGNDTMAPVIPEVAAGERAGFIFRAPYLLTFMFLSASMVLAESPKAPSPKEPKSTVSDRKNQAKKLLSTGLEALKLPTDAVVVIVGKVAEGFGSDPKQIILSPAAYKKLMERIADLERRLNSGKPVSPSTCYLKIVGSMDGDSAHVRAELKFKAEKDKTRIVLGCGGASPQKPELDGKETLLENGDDGLLVEVDAGQHVLTIELDVAVKSGDTSALEGGTKRTLKMELPRAAVTTVEMEQLPLGVAEARCNGQVVRKGGETVALGAAKDLVISWVKPVALAADGPWLTADAAITVRVEEKHVVTEALFTLQNLRKGEARWVLETPPQTEAEVVPLDKSDARIPAHTILSDAKKERHTIVLKEPGTDTVGVFLRSRQPRAAGRIFIGPFPVLEAAGRLRRQQGVIRVKTPPAGIRLIHGRSAEAVFHVSRAEITEKDRLDSVVYRFNYWSLPAGVGPARKGALPRPYLLELEAKTVRGIVRARVEHLLELHEKDQGWVIQATTRIQAQPIQAGVDFLEIQLPRTWPTLFPLTGAGNLALILRGRDGGNLGPRWPPTASLRLERTAIVVDRNGLTDTIEDLTVSADGKLRVTFPEKKDAEFTLVLKGAYAVAPGEHHAILELPLPLNVRDQGSEVKIVAPFSQQLLVGETGRDSPAPGRSRLTIASETAQELVEFGWRPFRHDLPVTVVADVTLSEGKAAVQQRIRFASAKPLTTALLRLVQGPRLDPAVARAIIRSLKIPSLPSPARASVEIVGPGPWPIPLAPGEDGVLVLRYELPAPAAGLMEVPLFELDELTRIDTKVRVWSLPGPTSRTLAAVEGLRWSELKLERAADRDHLPLLVLQGRERAVPLVLRLSQSPLPPLATGLVERGFIRVTSLPRGGHSYRARFRLAKLSGRSLDVELPALAARVLVMLDGVQVSPRNQPLGAGLPTPPSGRTGEGVKGGVRVRIDADPESFPGPVLLEVSYEIAPREGETGPDAGDAWGGLKATLYPPVLQGMLFLGKIRWQVDPAPGQLFLNPGVEAVSEQRWGVRGWLLARGPALTGVELERWLTGKEAAAEIEPALLCWQSAPEPLHLVRVARKTWLLLCSLGFLALGLGLSFAPLLRGLFRVLCWGAVTVVGLAVIATAVLWPGLLPDVVYGCEPGVVVLVPILLVQWMMQKRYRRQVVFMPGFTRLKAGSSLARAAAKRPTEPSTVDKQPASESVGSRTGM
jgi:hypothetical protein